MGTKDYEVRNKDYSSGEYHLNGGDSRGSNYNEYSKNDNSNFVLFIITFFILGSGVFLALYYGDYLDTIDFSASKTQEKPVAAKPSVNSNTNSGSYDNNRNRVEVAHNNREDNKPVLKKVSPLEKVDDEEKRKRFEAKRNFLLGKFLKSKRNSNQTQSQESGSLANINQEKKDIPVPANTDVSKSNNSENANDNRISEVSSKSENKDNAPIIPEEAKPKVNNENEEIYNYIKNGELINIFMLSEKGKKIEDFYYNNEPAVCIAVRYDRFEILKYLIHEFDCKKTVNKENKRNALHYAVIYYNLNTVQFLLDNGFSPNEKDSEGNTPLHYAVGNNLLECVKMMQNQGADPNVINNKKQNALHLAVKNDNAEMVGFLVKKGANVNQQDNEGNTPLHYCSMFSLDNRPLMKELYKYEDQFDLSIKNNNGKTPRNIRESDCFDNYEKNRNEKIKQINSQNENNKSGETKKKPVHLEKYLVFNEESSIEDAAIDFSEDNSYVFCPGGPIVIPFQPMMVRLFLAQIAVEKDHAVFLGKLCKDKFHPINEPEKFIPINSKVILSMVLIAADKDSRKCVDVLIDNGADLKIEAQKPKEKQKEFVEEGKTLLHCAAQYGNIPLMKKVIEAGVPLNKKTVSGKTPLYFAVKNNQYESVYMLIENGAEREESLKSETNDDRILKLLEKGLDSTK